MDALKDSVALVTGASRGAGRGIAVELGAAGATVYVSGRSVDGKPTTDNVPGTIDVTAGEVTARGGRGIAVRCDHTVDEDVEALFDRIRRDQGRLDLLVNNVWGGYEDSECRPLPRSPFWEQPLHQWEAMFTAGVRSHLVSSRLAVPLMLPQRRGLIVSTTAHLDPLPYLRNLFYDVSKNAVARLVRAMALELREHGIAALAVAPGFMRTERVVEAFRRAGAMSALDGPGGPRETPAYLGRAVAALAADRRVIEKTGQVLEVGALAREYGFADVDGRQPPPFRIPDRPAAPGTEQLLEELARRGAGDDGGVLAVFAGLDRATIRRAAAAFASRSGRNLLSIDLSGLVSNHIGETQKNLDQVFTDAERSGAILFFDEADVLFGREAEGAVAAATSPVLDYLLRRRETCRVPIVLAVSDARLLPDRVLKQVDPVLSFAPA